MALYVTVTANYDAAGRLEIRRISNTGVLDPGPDMVSTYAVTRDGARLGTVTHRYGDGAWALVRAALGLPVP